MSTTRVPKQMVSGDYPRGQVSLTDAATVAVDASLGDIFDLAMAGDHTIGAPTNPVDGQPMTLRILASGADRTPSFDAIFRVGSTVALPTTISSGKTTCVGARYNEAAVKWDVLAVAEGF